MADPFSIAVGILTVFGTTGTVSRFLNDVIRLSKVPDILLELNNELVDLHMLVQRIHDVLHDESEVLRQELDENLVRSLLQVRTLLSKLEKLIAYDLTKVGPRSNQAKLDRSRWFRKKSIVQDLREQLKTKKHDLVLTLSFQTRSSTLQNLSRSQQTSVAIDDLQKALVQAQDGMQDQLRAMRENVQAVAVGQRSLENRTRIWSSRNRRQGQNIALMKRNLIQSREIGVETQIIPRETADDQEVLPHDRDQGLSLYRSAEQSALVKNSEVSNSPQRHARTKIRGDSDHLRQPYALRARNFQSADMLIRRGADLHKMNNSGVSPFQLIWRTFFTESTTAVKLSFLLISASSESHFEELGLSALHKAYAGLSDIDFKQCLNGIPRNTINHADATGCTVLSCAAQRGDVDTVTRLLLCGADPDIADQDGKTPLHHAASAGKTHCMRQLLEAKTNVNCKDRWDFTPLMLASQWRTSIASTLLLDYGADITARDNFGLTALHHAARCDSVESVERLLERGADINAKSAYGATASTQAIYSHSHHTIEFFCGRSHLLKTYSSSEASRIVDIIVCHGDQRTLTILHRANIYIPQFGSDTNNLASSMLSLAQRRRDHNSERSRQVINMPDEDPNAWFETFMIFYDGMVNRSSNIIEEVPDEREWETTDGSEDSDQDEWEDAPDQPEDGE